MSIPLPPLPPQDCRYDRITKVGYTPDALRARDQEIVRCVLEAAAKYLDNVHATRLHKFANAIRALEFHHE